MKKTVLLLFLLMHCLVRAQDLPWYFNTLSFRSWAIENDVRSLLLPICFEPDEDAGYSFSHQTYFESDYFVQKRYVSERGYFVQYFLDTAGYVEKAASMEIEIKYAASAASDTVRQRVRALMEGIAVGKNPAFKVDTVIASPYMGSTYYQQGKRKGKGSSINADGSVNVIGEKITDRYGVTYRENVLNVYDSLLGFHFGYDKNLLKIIHYSENVPVTVCSYLFMGDCYDPISTRERFVPVSDSIAILMFSGVMNLNPCYLQPVDTVFSYPVYTFRKSVDPGAAGLAQYVKNVAAAHTAQVLQYGSGEIRKDTSYMPLVMNHVFDYKSGGVQTRVHSLTWDSHAKPYDRAEIYQYHEVYRSGKQLRETIRTRQVFYKNGALKKTEYARYDLKKTNWVLIGTEKYAPDGRLASIEMDHLEIPAIPWAQMERADLGFLELLQTLRGEISVVHKDGELTISTDEETVLRAGKNELLIDNIPVYERVYSHYGYRDNACKRYCTYVLKVVR